MTKILFDLMLKPGTVFKRSMDSTFTSKIVPYIHYYCLVNFLVTSSPFRSMEKR